MSFDAAEPIVFISRHGIKEGRLEAFRQAYAKGADAIDREKPDTAAFLAYLDEDRREVSTVHVFPDAAAMDRHFEGVEERAAGAAEYLEFREFTVYGTPSDEAMSVLDQAATAGTTLTFHPEWVGGHLRSAAHRSRV